MRLDVYSMLYFCLNQICTKSRLPYTVFLITSYLQSTSCSSLIELDGHIHFLYIASTLQTSTFVSEIICNNNRVPVRTATLLRSSDLKVHVILSFGASSQTPRDTGRSGTLPWCHYSVSVHVEKEVGCFFFLVFFARLFAHGGRASGKCMTSSLCARIHYIPLMAPGNLANQRKISETVFDGLLECSRELKSCTCGNKCSEQCCCCCCCCIIFSFSLSLRTWVFWGKSDDVMSSFGFLRHQLPQFLNICEFHQHVLVPVDGN